MSTHDEQIRERIEETYQLIDKVEDVLDGENIGVIISTLLFWLAEMYDEEVMPLDSFIEEANKTLRGFISKRGAKQGEIRWLQ